MRVQEDHDAANDLLVGPAGGDLSGADFADARNFAKPFGRLLDDVEHRRAEGLHQLAGIDRADALDHARTEVALDAGQGGRREILTNTARNCRPCSRSVTQLPERTRIRREKQRGRGRSG
jgi:hypothetical protein